MILHADMDAFYASIEQRDYPQYRNRPIAVGGTGPRGVISAASYEARPYGVRSAMPTEEARRCCPDLIVIPGDMMRYRRESKRVFEIFAQFSPTVEGLSLDEAFIDLAEKVKEMTRYATEHAITIAIMGCRVNGPGETDDADLGLWCGPNTVNLKRGPELVGQFSYEKVLTELKQELDTLIAARL